MRLNRFFTPTPIEGKTIIVTDEKLLHQWRNVLKLKTGEEVVLFDGTGSEFICSIERLEAEGAQCRVTERRPGVMPEKTLWLFVSLTKKDKFEWVAEKSTELGVSHIVPVLAERSEKKGLSEERLRKIILEATEQSGRGKPPALHGIFTLSEAAALHKMPLVAAHPGTTGTLPREKILGVFIGPEGGWTDRELLFFKEKNIPLISLGGTTLRAETAAIAAATRFLS